MRPDTVLVVLPERAGLPEAGPLAADLARALADSRPVRVETTATKEIGLPILQLLVAAHREAAGQGTRLEVTVAAGSALARSLDAHAMTAAGLRIEAGLWTGLSTSGAAA
ncbi:hypothetical protein SAMN05878503_12727 [Cereibacter ovatus]|uniref:STAS domain-containing protein n=1 Tax=Cereibacter ovatus TaxID=439529 RepID=A0A285D4Z9_9RHOB|nr:hypothetical protein [Cereibacter ovatus]SNX74884.1 hypothetical protein SAMN05878503_12727 [Cereibacter ovatus]